MAVTAITRIHNQSQVSIALKNTETPSNNTAMIAPGDSLDVSIWVPWAPVASDFAQHHLTVEFSSGSATLVIWQAAITGDGDFVRYSDDGAWHLPGLKVGGIAEVGGDRHLVVFDDRLAMIEPGRQGLTSIVRIDNGSSASLNVLKLDGDKPIQAFDLAPGESMDVDIWVPWVLVPSDLIDHNIALNLNGVGSGMLWQSNQADGDFVRMTSDATWRDPAPKVNGTDQVGGDRAMVVLDGSVELMSAARRPRPPQGEGDETITLSKTPTQFKFTSTVTDHPGRLVVSVTNDTRDNQDKVRIPLLVNLDSASGNVGQNRIDPDDTSNAFTGFPFDGTWTGIAVDVNQVFLRDFVTLSVHWRRQPGGIPDIVECVRRLGSDITAIGGTDENGVHWSLSEQEAVQAVKSGRNFYVIGVNGKRTRCVVKKSGRGKEFLGTLADDTITNNLSELPLCPQ